MLVGKDLGPFRIEAELGSGAMGSVYRAVRRDTGKTVAVKVIAYGLLGNERAVERFEREGEILKQLRHPNIVRFVGTGSFKKTPFFIMEFVEGESLDKLLARRGALPWDEVVAFGRQLCAALQHAHEKGIIHRDLKPSNLMILKDGTLKLTDFGIAKDPTVTGLTGTNCTVGTAAYMSPEQCRGEKTISQKSDLYSMGVVFYELLTGRKPFQADSPVEMFQAHVFKEFERPSRYVMDIPVWLDTLVCQLLEKKPEHRPFDASMVAKVLDEVQQKVADLRSAGVDAVTLRASDRGLKKPADETERDVARTLRGAVSNRKLRKKRVPLTQRKWFQATLLVTALLGLAGLVYAMTRPPSAEKLYKSVEAAFAARDYDGVTTTAAKYLRLYGGRDDEAAHRVEVWDRSIRVDRREQQLHNRVYGKLKFQPANDLEKRAFEALGQEDRGDLDEARAIWRNVEAKAGESEGDDAGVYAWLAQKKLADLDVVPKLRRKLAEVLEYEHALAQPGPKPELSPVEKACFEAYRFEEFGDRAAARDRWKNIREEYAKSLEERGWAILAAEQYHRLTRSPAPGVDQEREIRLKLLSEKVAAAEAVPSGTGSTTARRQAVSDCRDIVALYSKDADPKVSAFADKARKLLTDRRWTQRES
jgi:serine/threonine-protein kinase